MSGIKRKKCRHCHRLFVSNHRNKNRQRYCNEPECRKASKADSQKRWNQKPENVDYFRGPHNVARVQEWRKGSPGYWRTKPENGDIALQDPLIQQTIDKTDNNSAFTNRALQDLLTVQPSVLIGIIAQLTGYALQDDIAMAVRRMQQLGDDILNPQSQGGRHGSKNTHLPGSYP